MAFRNFRLQEFGGEFRGLVREGVPHNVANGSQTLFHRQCANLLYVRWHLADPQLSNSHVED